MLCLSVSLCCLSVCLSVCRFVYLPILSVSVCNLPEAIPCYLYTIVAGIFPANVQISIRLEVLTGFHLQTEPGDTAEWAITMSVGNIHLFVKVTFKLYMNCLKYTYNNSYVEFCVCFERVNDQDFQPQAITIIFIPNWKAQCERIVVFLC